MDIPRCHQYDELLASANGQAKLKRVIKSFLLTHKENTYWQGLDSVAAPFVRLNFDDEAIAFGCYEAFFEKYLYAFCRSDSDIEMYKYNAIFRQLLCYHSPELGWFMTDNHESVLQQFSVKNFLTMFSHVLPINLIYHLWDSIIASDATFPLFIGVAFLLQMEADHGIRERPDEDVWSMITDAPEMQVEQCLAKAKVLFCATPASACRNRAPRDRRAEVLAASRLAAPARALLQGLGADRPSSERLAADALGAPAPPKKVPLSYEELLASRALIIAGEDVVKMLSLRRHGSQCLFVDIRVRKDFRRGCLPESINVPADAAFTNPTGGFADPQVEVHLTKRAVSLVKVVVGAGEALEEAVAFANHMIQLGICRVCILQGGLPALKSLNLLVLPPEGK